ncbi:MAG: protein translocase subunit SecD [Ruminococcaceae bacterium]|nr:protein translocase subunit SecD [Oscillospiraceae bacterium]
MGKPVFFIVAIVVVALCYVSAFGVQTFIGDSEIIIKSAKDMRLGIDINGGVEAYFQPADESINPTEEELESIRAILVTRMDSKNIADREITVDKESGTVLVRFPWKSNLSSTNPEKAIEELGETAKLTFVDPDGKVVVEGKNVVDAYPTTDSGKYFVALEFDEAGATAFSNSTKTLSNTSLSDEKRIISIKMDDQVISAPIVNAHITDGKAVIEGMASAQEAKELAAKIKAGALPFDIETRSFSTISPILGNDALMTMLWAGLVSFILIALFMIFYYRLPGFVACFGLAAQAAIQILILAITQYTLTLPGIAGIILTIGMGVDTNVIICERIKEEIKSGKTMGTAIDIGYKKAYSAIVDANITTLIVAVLLYFFGSGAMKSFGFTLGVGVALNFITGVTLSHVMVSSITRFSAFKKRFFFGVKKEDAAQ